MSARRLRAWLVGLALMVLGAGGLVVVGGGADPARGGLMIAAAPAGAETHSDPPDDHGDHGEVDPDSDEPEDDGSGGQAPAVQGAAGCDQSELPPHDGEQEGQRCAPTAIGELPNPEDIPAVLITSPEDGTTLRAGEDFQIVVAVRNLASGNFADPNTRYYARPQELDDEGRVIGHAHVAVQRLDGQDPEGGDEVPAALDIEFFKGLEEEAEGGQLAATVPGLDAGVYRILANAASEHHAAFASPVARHAFAVDGIRIQVQADADGKPDAPQEEGQQEATSQPVAVAAQAPPPGGDGIPPAPSSTRPDAGGGGGGPAAGSGGAGDGQPPPPVVTRAPAASAPADQPPSGYAQPVADQRGINAWVVGGGLLVFVGAGVVALTRLRRRHPRSRPAPTGYHARHLDDDDGEDGQDPPGPAAEADTAAAAALSGELGRLTLQQPPDAANRPERDV